MYVSSLSPCTPHFPRPAAEAEKNMYTDWSFRESTHHNHTRTDLRRYTRWIITASSRSLCQGVAHHQSSQIAARHIKRKLCTVFTKLQESRSENSYLRIRRIMVDLNDRTQSSRVLSCHSWSFPWSLLHLDFVVELQPLFRAASETEIRLGVKQPLPTVTAQFVFWSFSEFPHATQHRRRCDQLCIESCASIACHAWSEVELGLFAPRGRPVIIATVWTVQLLRSGLIAGRHFLRNNMQC